MGQTIPKLRMDAPTACKFLSITVTLYPRMAKALAVAKPTMPAPMIRAEFFDMFIYLKDDIFY
jgi:hypothetical protein